MAETHVLGQHPPQRAPVDGAKESTFKNRLTEVT